MKKILLSVMILWLAVLAAHSQAQLRWLEIVHDFGAFNEELETVTAEFRFVSTGTEPVVITDARVSCGCTVARYSTDPIAPGDTAVVSVVYDASGRPGRFSKEVYVYTNTDPERSQLEVKGIVIGTEASIQSRYPVKMGELRFERSSALLGSVNKGHIKNVYFKGYNRSNDSIAYMVEDLPAWVEVIPIPEVVPPGEQCQLNFFIMSDKTPLYGLVTDTVTVVPDRRKPAEKFRLPVVITINENFGNLTEAQRANAPVARLSTELVGIGAVPAGTKGKGTVSLTNAGKSPLLIRRIYSADKGVTASAAVDKVAPGRSTPITVTVDPAAADGGILDARMVVITNDPGNPSQVVRVTAELPAGK